MKNTLKELFSLLDAINIAKSREYTDSTLKQVNQIIKYYGWNILVDSESSDCFLLVKLEDKHTKIVDIGDGILMEVDE